MTSRQLLFTTHPLHSPRRSRRRGSPPSDMVTLQHRCLFLRRAFLFWQKGWLPRAKLRPLVKIRLARPIRGHDFRWSFFLFGPVWFTAMNYAFMALKWWLLLSIQFMNNTWTLLYVHFHWKKTECFRVAKTQNEWSFKAKNVTVGAEEQ